MVSVWCMSTEAWTVMAALLLVQYNILNMFKIRTFPSSCISLKSFTGTKNDRKSLASTVFVK